MIEWNILTEFESKKGQDIVVCNLSEHVPILGVETYIECPMCSRPEQTIGYSDKRRRKLNTNGYVGYCYRCGRAFINPNNVDKDIITLPQIKFDINVKNYEVEDLDSNVLDRFGRLTEDDLTYLHNRNKYITTKVADWLHMRSAKNGIVIPFYLENRFVYYTIRFKKVAPNMSKYYMPPTKVKPIYIPFFINNKNFIIVEGCFDSIACLKLFPNYTPVAILGSKITLNQLMYLSTRYNPENILVYLDDTGKSLKTMKFIKNAWKGMYNIDIIKSNGEDPEERLNRIG